MKILILSGLPASGKSTYAKELMKKEPGKWKRINKDLLREMLDDSVWSKENERVIIGIRDTLIRESLEMNYNVIVDDTNFAEKHIQTVKNLALQVENYLEKKVEVETKFFDTPVQECIERDAKREKSVGKKVILDMYSRYLKETPKELSRDTKLVNCFIVDIDGTLAQMNGRTPFEYHKVGTDLVNKNLVEIISALSAMNYRIIILTGRESVCGEETLEWLRENNIKHDGFFMRKEGDHRCDTIIKREMYEAHIKGKYNVIGVFDDRGKVIRMWKEQGLFVMDCNRDDSRIEF